MLQSAFIESISVPALLLDENDLIVVLNKNFSKRFLIAEADARNRSFSSIGFVQYKDSSGIDAAAVMAGEMVYSPEPGTHFIVTPITLPDWLGKCSLKLYVFAEITELRVMERRLSLAQETARIGSWERNIQTGEEFWSPQLFKILGYNKGGVPNVFDWVKSIIHEDDLALMVAANERAISECVPLNYTARFRSSCNHYVFLQILGRVEYDQHGKPYKMYGICQDISEKRKTEEELNQHNITLRYLLGQIEREKNIIREEIALNIERNVKPILTNLKRTVSKVPHSPEVLQTLNHMEKQLNYINDSFLHHFSQMHDNLSPHEIRICYLVRSGYPIKEIAATLNVSANTVKNHLANIRKKLGLINKRFTLKNYFSKISKQPEI